jgi:hypothetical protein
VLYVTLPTLLALLTPVGAASAARPAVNLTVSGRFKTTTLRDKVRFGEIRCIPVGHGANVQWSGQVGVGKAAHQLTGEIDFQKPGKQSFGPKGIAIASLVVDGDYKDRLGSGFPRAGGNGTVAKNGKSGAISLTLLDGASKIHVQGSWTCG